MFGVSDIFISDCLDNFAHDIQPDILQEECAELIQAISKFKRNKCDNTRIIEEMSHVLISSAVVAKLFNISEQDIHNEIIKKADKYGFKY